MINKIIKSNNCWFLLLQYVIKSHIFIPQHTRVKPHNFYILVWLVVFNLFRFNPAGHVCVCVTKWPFTKSKSRSRSILCVNSIHIAYSCYSICLYHYIYMLWTILLFSVSRKYFCGIQRIIKYIYKHMHIRIYLFRPIDTELILCRAALLLFDIKVRFAKLKWG